MSNTVKYGECPVCGVNSDFDDVWGDDVTSPDELHCPVCGYDPDEWPQESQA